MWTVRQGLQWVFESSGPSQSPHWGNHTSVKRVERAFSQIKPPGSSESAQERNPTNVMRVVRVSLEFRSSNLHQRVHSAVNSTQVKSIVRLILHQRLHIEAKFCNVVFHFVLKSSNKSWNFPLTWVLIVEKEFLSWKNVMFLLNINIYSSPHSRDLSNEKGSIWDFMRTWISVTAVTLISSCTRA